MRDGFIKIAAATPDLHVADCAYNTSEIVKLAKEAAAKGAKLITFPELCLTGYTCGDLFLQETLLEGAMQALSLRLSSYSVCRCACAVSCIMWPLLSMPVAYWRLCRKPIFRTTRSSTSSAILYRRIRCPAEWRAWTSRMRTAKPSVCRW